MNLKHFFLLLFLVTNFQNNLFCSSGFDEFQKKCAMPISFIIVGATLFGVSVPPLLSRFLIGAIRTQKDPMHGEVKIKT